MWVLIGGNRLKIGYPESVYLGPGSSLPPEPHGGIVYTFIHHTLHSSIMGSEAKVQVTLVSDPRNHEVK